MAATWDGDDYATFEEKSSKRLILFTRTRLDRLGDADAFFEAYRDAWKKKYPERTIVSDSEDELDSIALREARFSSAGKRSASRSKAETKKYSRSGRRNWDGRAGFARVVQQKSSGAGAPTLVISASGAGPLALDRRFAWWFVRSGEFRRDMRIGSRGVPSRHDAWPTNARERCRIRPQLH